MKLRASLLSLLFVLASHTPAGAQISTTMEGLSLRDTMSALTSAAAPGLQPVGDAIGLATALEVTTASLGSSASGFVFKLDPVTGLRVRTATTFGPSFAERALTAGEGKVSFAANLIVATYDKINELSLRRMELARTTATTEEFTLTGMASMVLSSETVVISGAVGATDNLDVLVAVPMVKVKLDAIMWEQDATGKINQRAAGSAIASGLGDVAVSAKYRFLKFGDVQPDPGGLAFMLTGRLPTGNRENFRGLGLSRVMGSLLFSSGQGRFRPHANAGFEWWEKGIVVTSLTEGNQTARHQVQFAAGFELEAGPKMTLILDLLGRKILGGGRVETQHFDLPPNDFGGLGLDAAIATSKGVQKLTLVPGFKWNLKGSFLASVNALIPLHDTGLHDRFTPVVGLDWTF